MIEPRVFDDAGKYLAFLRSSNSHWIDNESWHQEWVFRGQRDANWRIEPSAWRNEIEKHELFVHLLKEVTGEQANRLLRSHRGQFASDDDAVNLLIARRVSAFKQFEYIVVKDFVELADELGFRVPEAKKHIENAHRLANPFSNSVTIKDNRSIEDFSLASLLAQHHGIPTRFVDWARDPIVAACFATQNWNGNSDIAVYALHKLKVRSTHYRIVAPTRYEFDFLHAQGGLFSIASQADTIFCSTGEWPNIEDELEADTLQKLVLQRKAVLELKRMLWLERRTQAHLMPTLDNVTKTLKDSWLNRLNQ